MVAAVLGAFVTGTSLQYFNGSAAGAHPLSAEVGMPAVNSLTSSLCHSAASA